MIYYIVMGQSRPEYRFNSRSGSLYRQAARSEFALLAFGALRRYAKMPS